MTSSTDDSRGASSSPLGTSNGTWASASVRLARTMRCATVASETRKARAISAVVRPPSSRSVSAIRASVESTGWQQVNTSRSRSSATSSTSSAARLGGERDLELAARAPAACARASRRGAARRSRGAWRWPSARRPGCPGRPTPATSPARRRARPARGPRRGRRRARSAPARRSAAPTRSARPRRSCAGWRSPGLRLCVGSARAALDLLDVLVKSSISKTCRTSITSPSSIGRAWPTRRPPPWT